MLASAAFSVLAEEIAHNNKSMLEGYGTGRGSGEGHRDELSEPVKCL